jgi:transcriptional regulator GlxA family with amidase domain
MPTTRNLAILVFEGVEVLDFCGPFEVFAVASRFTDTPAFHVFTAAERSGPVLTRGGLSVNPHCRLTDCPRPDLRRGRVWSVRPIPAYPSHGRLRGGAERPLVAGRRA